MKIKYFLITVALAIAILFFGSGIKAQTTDIQALIAQLQAQIQVLLQQIAQLQNQQDQGQTWCHTFNANMGMGQKTGNPEIDALKTVLEKEDLYNSAIAVSPDDSEGYNEALASAITGFQEKYASEILTPYNLKHGTGYVGKSTRAKLNALYGCGTKSKVCTQDAKQCSDGSYVSRTGPNCEFAQCPKIQCTIDSDCPQPNCGNATTGTTPNCIGSSFKCIEGKCVPATTSNQAIRVISPNGGETYKSGDSITVNWKTAGVSSSEILSLIRLRAYLNGQEYNLVSNTLNDGQEVITLPSSVPVGAYTLEIKTYVNNVLVFDASDSYFKIISVIQPSSVTVLSPNGGETWTKETTQTIKWQDNMSIQTCPAGEICSSLTPKYYDIKLVTYYPSCTGTICPAYAYPAPYTIATNVSGSSSSWYVGKIVNYDGTGGIAPDGSYTIQICQTGTDTCDSSDSYFKIVPVTTTCPTVNCFTDNCPGKHLPDSNGCINCSTPCPTTQSLTASSSYLIGDQTTYTAGQTIKFSVKGVASDNNAGTPEKGFNVQNWMQKTDPIETVKINDVYQSFNASYNSATGYWDVVMTAPSDTSQKYLIDTAFYCSNPQLGCSKGQINKSFTFSVVASTTDSNILQNNLGSISDAIARIAQAIQEMLKK